MLGGRRHIYGEVAGAGRDGAVGVVHEADHDVLADAAGLWEREECQFVEVTRSQG